MPRRYPVLDDPPPSVLAILLRVAGMALIVLAAPVPFLPLQDFPASARATLFLLGIALGIGLFAFASVVSSAAKVAHWTRKTAEFTHESVMASGDRGSGY